MVTGFFGQEVLVESAADRPAKRSYQVQKVSERKTEPWRIDGKKPKCSVFKATTASRGNRLKEFCESGFVGIIQAPSY